MALVCPNCGRQYDVTLFEYGRRVRCDCGLELSLERGTTRHADEDRSRGGKGDDEADRPEPPR